MAFGSVASLSMAAGLLALTSPCDASVWQAKTEDVEMSLIAELSVLVHTGQPHRLEAALRPIYSSLPKSAQGSLEPDVVRSALHRLFLQRPGWSVKGLEPGSSAESWVPAYLLKLLEDRAGERGLGLRELAALAASLEDLARKEATARLEWSYQAVGLPLAGRADRARVMSALRMYAEGYVSGNASDTEASSRQKWLERLAADHWKAGGSDDGKLSFQDAGASVLLIERQLSRFKSQECSSVEPAVAQSRCLDVSSLYSLCCRSGAEGPTTVAPEPSVWVAAWTDYPGLWIFSLVCFLLTAVLNLCRWLCGHPSAEGPAQSEEESTDHAKSEDVAKPQDVAKPEEETTPTGLLGTCVALCLVCAVAVAVDLLDITVIAPALAVGLALLAAARLAPRQHVKAKKV
mmetsp:Transcript_101262/g.246249  ORF Transcript_101262/g.246249 Transcript_101262/m.246249 type:complete len:404 (-) Transcript_101262:82-1293(-)